MCWPRTCYPAIMLEPLRQSLVNPSETPAVMAKGLRGAVLGVYVSQVVMVLVVAGLVMVFAPQNINARGWAVWLAGFSFVLFVLVSAVVARGFDQKRSFAAALHAAILLGVASTVPAILACLLLTLEGARAGASALAFTSALLLAVSLTRVTGYALRIQHVPKEVPEPFAGFGSSSEFERPDWARSGERFSAGQHQPFSTTKPEH
jgi:hypothetical protein